MSVNDELPPRLQKLIKNILDNDMEIKKVKRFEKTKEASKEPKASKEPDTDEEPEVEEKPEASKEPEKPIKPKKKTKSEKEKEFARQYLEEVALGNLKYQDKSGKNRTKTFKQWFSSSKDPQYDEDKDCWTIPDPSIFTQRTLAMKTIGSLFKKTYDIPLSEIQVVITAFLNELDSDDYNNLSNVLSTPHIGNAALKIMSNWYNQYKNGGAKKQKILTNKQRQKREQEE